MVSIGEDEQHRLRMLMEQIFGPTNFVAQLAVEMSTTSGPKTTNAQQGTIVKNLEYVLIFRKGPEFDTTIRHTPLYDGVDKWDANYPLWLEDDGHVSNLYDTLDSQPAIREDIERLGLVESKGRRKGKFVGAKGMDLLLLASDAAASFISMNLGRIARTDTAPVSAKGVEVAPGRWVEHVTPDRSYRITRSREGKIWQVYTLERNYRQSDDYEPRFGRTVIRGDLWKGFHSDMAHVSREGGVVFANGKKPVRLMSQLIRWANNDPNAVILDFFGGSGSTAHAVAKMNEADGGSRQSITVTNNELSRDQRREAISVGARPGDPSWEALGVYEVATKPRIIAMAKELKANVVFFTLTYEAPRSVRHNRTFARIAPMLWMRSGSQGRIIKDLGTHGWDVAEAYGVLEDLDHAGSFLAKIEEVESVRTVFIVTDDDSSFQMVCRDLPGRVLPIRLYESYLQNFQLRGGR